MSSLPERFEDFPLYSPRQLPDVEGETLSLTWDQLEADSIIRHEDSIIWRERTGWEVYERFEEIALILKHKYGRRLVDLVPTPGSRYALYGDSTAASFHVSRARESLGREIATETFHWFRLEAAVRQGDAATIKKYLAQDGDPNVRSVARGSADTLLHIAARHRRPAMARMLIASRANVNAMDSLGRPPLVAALDTQFIAAHLPAQRLRSNPEALQPARTTDLVRLLVFAGANLSGLNRPFSQVHGLKREMYRSPLALAAQYGYTDALRFLLEQGAAVDVEDYLGDTPLIEALRWGQAETAQILLAVGADVNREPYSPDQAALTQLLLVIRSERFDPAHKVPLIQRMIEAGADVNRANAVGDSPLLTAVRFGTDHYYAIIGLTDPANNVTWQVMKWPVQQKVPPAQIAPLIRVLRAAGADISARDRDGKTARDLASEGGLTELVAFL